jgi:hypothetical protein
MLPDDYLRKLKQDLAEADAAADTVRNDPEVEEGDESQSSDAPLP